MRFLPCYLLFFLLQAPLLLSGQAGRLDTSFGDNGIVITNVLSKDAFTAEIAMIGDRIFSAGTLNNDSLFVLCQDMQGKIDSTFGINGIKSIALEQGAANCTFIKPAGNGKLFIGGTVRINNKSQGFTMKLMDNGEIDPGFNWLEAIFAALDGSLLPDAAVYPNGNVLAAGTLGEFGGDYLFVQKDSTGFIELDFNFVGELVIPRFGNYDYMHFVHRLPDNKTLSIGRSINLEATTDVKVTAIKLRANGMLDTEFSSDGKAAYDISPYENIPFGALVQDDGSAIIGTLTGSEGIALLYIDNQGVPVPSFGDNGIVTHVFGTDPTPLDMVQQDDGRIVIAGLQRDKNSTSLMRLNPDGSIDSTFGHHGEVIYDLSDSLDYWTSMLALPENRILVAGDVFKDGIYQHAIAVIISDSTTSVRNIQHQKIEVSVFPNPFSESITVHYHLSKPQFVRINVYDQVSGNKEIIGREFRNAGINTEQLVLPKAVPAGMYVLEILGEYEVGKVVVVKGE